MLKRYKFIYVGLLVALAGLMVPGWAQEEEKTEVRGAPLGATDEVEEETEGETAGMEKIRTIPKESLELMEKIEASAKVDPDNITFEKTKDGKHLKVSFAALSSFIYEMPDPEIIRKSDDPFISPIDQIPGPIKEVDGKEVIIVGFMVPIEINRKGKVRSFALTVNQAFCCYGVPPAMNEWVMVEMADDLVADFVLDLPVAAYGTLHVGEEIDDGYVLSVYRMTSTEVIDVRELLKRTKSE